VSDEVLPYRRLSPLTPIAKSGVWLAAAAFTIGRDIMNGSELSMLAVVAGAIVGLGLVSGFASWWRTKFRISDTELLIESGLISRHSRRVRLDRIVAIDINQPFIARLLGVAELRIETGTTDSEARLAYLPVAEATSMRHTLLARRQAPGELAPEDAAAGPVPPVAPLVRVPLQWHLISILARPESILFVIAALTVIILKSFGFDLTAFGFSLAAVGGLGWSLVTKLIGRWNWELAVVPTGLQVRHGMFNVTTQTFHVARLQGLQVHEPVMWRPWGLASLQVSIAGGVKGDEEGAQGLLLPAAPKALVWQLAQELLGQDPSQIPLSPAGRHASWLAPASGRRLAFGFSDQLAVSLEGVFARRTSIVPLARAQSVSVRQGFMQSLLGLAALRIDTPRGANPFVARLRGVLEARAHVEQLATAALAARVRPQSSLDTSNLGAPPHLPHARITSDR